MAKIATTGAMPKHGAASRPRRRQASLRQSSRSVATGFALTASASCAGHQFHIGRARCGNEQREAYRPGNAPRILSTATRVTAHGLFIFPRLLMQDRRRRLRRFQSLPAGHSVHLFGDLVIIAIRSPFSSYNEVSAISR